MALTSDGRVFAWGDNTYGQLGLHQVGGVISAPTKLALSNVNGISAGSNHSLFAMYDGSLYAHLAAFTIFSSCVLANTFVN